MKNRESNLKWLCFLLTTVFLVSCQDKIEIEEIRQEEKSQEEMIFTRALSYQKASTSNPDLHSNWESVNKIVLNGGGLQVDPPWKVVSGNSMNIPEEFRIDIKKEDGWMMVSHTMIDKNDAEPNYILFYNRRSALLKGFYWQPTGVNNNSLVWVLESNIASSVIPSNIITQGVLNSTSQYATSNNVIEQSHANFGQLNQGWNAFSFELVYGTTNNKPNGVSIKAFNQLVSNITLKGNYTGQVQVPKVNKNDPVGGFGKILTSAGKVASGIGNYIPVVKSIGKAISAAGSALGGASGFFPKSSTTVYTTLQTKGSINLTGSSITSLGGAVSTLNNIPLANIINEPLGLWNLSSKPRYTYDRYQIITRYEKDHFIAYPQFVPSTNIKDLIVVNPNAQVKSYNVLSTEFVHKKNGTTMCRLNKVADECYFTENVFYVEGDENPYKENLSGYDVVYIYPNFWHIADYLNVTIEFEFIDGTKFISSRNFAVELIQNGNATIIRDLENQGKKCISIYH